MAGQLFRAGEVVFQPGDEGNTAYVVETGRIAILSNSHHGDTPIAEIRPGEIFGEMSLIEERPRMLTAQALVDSTLSSLTRDDFEDLLFRDPQRCRAYLKSLFERLRNMASRLDGDEPRGLSIPMKSVAPAPTVTLYPLTPRAASTVPAEGLTVPFLPFRVGRASEADEPEALGLNDLWLLDLVPFSVSRNHAVFQATADGQAQVSDRGSFLGVVVNGEKIGGGALRSAMRLNPGENTVIFGGKASQFRYRVVVAVNDAP